MPHPRTKLYTEALVNILVCIIAKTRDGGATKSDIVAAYREVNRNDPSDRTITRIIKKINSSIANSPGYSGNVIEKVAVNRKSRYQFAAHLLPKEPIKVDQARLVALSLYPHRHQNQILADKVQLVTDLFLKSIEDTANTINQFNQDLSKFVYIAEPRPVDDGKMKTSLSKILDAIRRQKSLKLNYTRNYDGVVSKDRLINPYGLICRHGIWYLTALNVDDRQLRVFRIDQINNIEVAENSHYTIPTNFSLQETYKHTWGVWTSDEPYQVETIRLRVKKGMAVKFRQTKYHESQEVKDIANGEAEITFRIAQAQEMIPFLLGWGDTVEVLEPQWLREEMRVAAKAIAARYP